MRAGAAAGPRGRNQNQNHRARSVGRPAPLPGPRLPAAGYCCLLLARRSLQGHRPRAQWPGRRRRVDDVSYAAGLMSDDDVPPFPPCWPDQFQSGRASSSWSRCTPSSVTVPPVHAHHKSMHTGTDTGRDRPTTTSTYIWTYMCILTD